MCKETWRKLRDNYRKAKQLRRTKSGQGAKKIKPIKFEKELAFLNPHLQQPQELQTSNLTVPSSNDETDEDDAENSNHQSTETFSEPPTPESTKTVSSASTSRPSNRMKRKQQLSMTPMQEYLQFKREQQVSQQPNGHPLDIFFSSIAATVKTFPAPMQLNIKEKVFQLVAESEAKLINPTPPKNVNPGPSQYAVQAETSTPQYRFNAGQSIDKSIRPLETNDFAVTPGLSGYAGQITNERQLLNLDDQTYSCYSPNV